MDNKQIIGYNSRLGKAIVSIQEGTIYTDLADLTGLPVAGQPVIQGEGRVAVTKLNIYSPPPRFKKRSVPNSTIVTPAKGLILVQDFGAD